MKVEAINGIYVDAIQKSKHTIQDKEKNIVEHIDKEVAYRVKISEEALKLLRRLNNVKAD